MINVTPRSLHWLLTYRAPFYCINSRCVFTSFLGIAYLFVIIDRVNFTIFFNSIPFFIIEHHFVLITEIFGQKNVNGLNFQRLESNFIAHRSECSTLQWSEL